MQNIDKTIQLSKDHMKELAKTQLKGEKLQKLLHWDKIELIYHKLDKLRTVCNDVAYKEYRDDGAGQTQTVTEKMSDHSAI